MVLTLIIVVSWVLFVAASFECQKKLWLHIPKTGSSFCLSLQHVCCTEQFDALTEGLSSNEVDGLGSNKGSNGTHVWSVELSYGCALLRKGSKTTCQINGAHSPLPVNVDFNRSDVFGLFRDPKKRIVSSFLDSKHHEGMPAQHYADMLNAMNNVSRRQKSDNEVTVELASIYMNHPDMLGCQVKMLLGHECSSPLFSNKPFDHVALSLAIERLHRFKFVGITDFFSLSVQLFHKMVGKHTVPSPIEFYVARATKDGGRSALLQNVSYRDPYDSALYAEAFRIFHANLKTFNLAHHLPVVNF